jgi:hypothetical protein
MNNKIVCQKCKFYFVTWIQGKPHGCKAYGFKSAKIPSMVVKQSSGIECTLFQSKNNN